MTDEDCVKVDATGKPLRICSEESDRLPRSSIRRCNWIAMHQIIETHRRLGNISERAAFEIYQRLESVCPRTRPWSGCFDANPFTYLHAPVHPVLLHVLRPFVFTTTFHWIGYLR